MIGTAIKDWRRANELRPKEAAALLQVSEATLYSWQSGRRKPAPWRIYQLLTRVDPAVAGIARELLDLCGNKYHIE